MEILKFVNELCGYLFYLFYIILFYLSLKKCFFKDDNKKGKLFLFSLITNPIIIFYGLTAFTSFIFIFREMQKSNFNNQAITNLATDQFYGSLIVLISSLLSIIVIIPISYLMGKYLKAFNKSLVMFVYIMFSVIIILDDGDITGIITLCLLYIFIMKALSKLSDRRRHVNWKLFLITPGSFIVGYSILDYYTSTFCSKDANIVVQILSYVICLLFIWAFYVIINNIKATDDAIKSKDEVKTLSVEVMEALANTIDAKDKYTNGHSIRVALYSRKIAEKMGLPEDTCENIYYMGLLHDIGKIGVPNEIINKPSRLDDNEYNIIKKHPGIGYDILSKIKSKPELMKGARWHHERFDGKGYPDQIAGEKIPIESRIIAIADSYDAMTSNRSYRQYLPQKTVRSEIEKNSGTQFDPEIAKYMLMIIDEDTEYVLHE